MKGRAISTDARQGGMAGGVRGEVVVRAAGRGRGGLATRG